MLDKEKKLRMKYRAIRMKYDNRIRALEKTIDSRLKTAVGKPLEEVVASYESKLSCHRFMDCENNMYVFKDHRLTFSIDMVGVIMCLKIITPQGEVRHSTVYTYARCHSVKQVMSEVKQDIQNSFTGMRAIKMKQFKYELLKRVNNAV